MGVQFNHTIVASRDPARAAADLADLLGVAPPAVFGPFQVVEVDHGASLDFMDWGDHEIPSQHYAFLVDEDRFDEIFGRITGRGLPHWADPHRELPDQINHHDGGRGVYWEALDGHLLEIITRPYGSGD